MKVAMNGHSIPFPGEEMAKMRESNDLIHDRDKLLQRISEEGYLLLRGLIDPQKVLTARRIILGELAKGGRIRPNTDLMEGVINPKAEDWRNPDGSAQPLESNPEVLAAINGEELQKFFEFFFGEPCLSLDLRIIRRVASGLATGIHYDVVYVGRGTKRLHTCWIPMGDIPVEQGPLAICAGSNSLEGFHKLRQTYGEHDVDRQLMRGAKGSFPGWFSLDLREITDRFGGQWCTTNFRSGDVLIFTLFTLHCGLDNTTDRFRLSSDVRFQPAADPVDERWIGKEAVGNREAHQLHEGKIDAQSSMEDARKKWQV